MRSAKGQDIHPACVDRPIGHKLPHRTRVHVLVKIAARFVNGFAYMNERIDSTFSEGPQHYADAFGMVCVIMGNKEVGETRQIDSCLFASREEIAFADTAIDRHDLA